MRYGSVCSGIEAATVAWHPLGWEPAWFAEIETFPSAVLAHHYPSVPNLGDMTKIAANVLSGSVEAPDILVGGTPCQAFSVAGLRNSLDDDRGQLTISFIHLADAIDAVRRISRKDESIIVWENVPGVLSTKDNAFGCFLAGLAGEDGELVPAGKRWTDAGCVYGPKRTIAWRILDAQYFGVAQRRRRVFVVASAREGFDPTAVLFEPEGVRRDTAPRRKTGQDVAGTLKGGSGDRGYPDPSDGNGGMLTLGNVAPNLTAGFMRPVVPDIVGSLCARDSKSVGSQFVDEGKVFPTIATFQQSSMKGKGTIGYDESGVAKPVKTQMDGQMIVVSESGDISSTLRTGGNDHSDSYNIVAVSPAPTFVIGFNGDQSEKTRSMGEREEQAPTLRAEAPTHVAYSAAPVVFHPTQDPINSTDGTTHAMGCGSSQGQCSIAIAVPPAPTFGMQANIIGRQAHNGGNGLGFSEEIAPTLTKSDQHGVVAPAIGWSEELTASTELAGTLQRGGDGGRHDGVMTQAMQVRRLTPVECERLQSFPDGYTNIPWRGKPESPDGPRYKALGNSMCCNVMHWIGKRIQQSLTNP